MVLCSELILAGLEENHRLRRFAEEIRKAGEQGAGLIQQLMAVARQRAIEPRFFACMMSSARSVICLRAREHRTGVRARRGSGFGEDRSGSGTAGHPEPGIKRARCHA
jgi:hypothetical protein